MVTLASPLGRNFPLQPVTPLAFSLSDVLQTIRNLTATEFGFEFATDSTGFIIEWSAVASAGPGTVLTQLEQDIGAFGSAFGNNTFSPGTWFPTFAAPDEGFSLALLSLSLTALGVAAR